MKGLLTRLRHLCPIKGFQVKRPVVLFHSDDWGLVGVRDREGWEELQAAGLDLGRNPYDFYSLETARDVEELCAVLGRHRDSIGRPPCFSFNFVVANVDFARVVESDFARLKFMPLDEGWPGRWRRPGLLEAYAAGIQKGLIYPAFHGLTHFSREAVAGRIQARNESGSFLRILFSADTPLLHGKIHHPTYEYWLESEGQGKEWLEGEAQRKCVEEGIRLFGRIFGEKALSACAPGYRANGDTHQAWAENGVRVAQQGPGYKLAPHFDESGLFFLYRNIPFEPALDPVKYGEAFALERAEENQRGGRPLVVCTHAVNFHSTLKNYRDLTLERLDRFLEGLESRYPDLLYLQDADLLHIVRTGGYSYGGNRVAVEGRWKWQMSPAAASRLRVNEPEDERGPRP